MAMVPSKGKKIGMRRLLMFLLGLARVSGLCVLKVV
jgi:aspartyl/asparaginyl-tRNA synthetase